MVGRNQTVQRDHQHTGLRSDAHGNNIFYVKRFVVLHRFPGQNNPT